MSEPRATAWDGPRGAFLETVFGSEESIGATDQGKSWQAFWDHLLSPTGQLELDRLLASTRAIPALAGRTAEGDQLLRRDLYTAAEVTQATVASLSAQLRRFLDEAAAAEERRIGELVRESLSAALDAARSGVDVRALGTELHGLRAEIVLPLERPMYTVRLDDEIAAVQTSTDDASDLDLADLLEHTSIDLGALRQAVADTRGRFGSPVSLGQVVAENPLRQGLAELVGYLQVADDSTHDDEGTELVEWVDASGTARRARLPRIVFDEPGPDSTYGGPW